MARWVQVARSEQLKENRDLGVVVEGKKIVLFRHQGRLFALRDSCPHQGAPLSHGYVRDCLVTCVYHGWKFSLEDGHFVSNPQLKIPTFNIQEKDGQILIELPD